MIKAFFNSLTPPIIKQMINYVRVSMQEKPKPEWVTVSNGPLKGLRLFIDPKTALGKDYLSNHDDFIYAHLDKYKSLNKIVFYDIGAHFGTHTLGFSLLAGPEGKVYAFEPHPLNNERLRKNIEANIAECNNITVIEEAISNSKGTVNFEMITELESGWSSTSRILETGSQEKETKVKRHIEVKTDTIDNLLSEGRIERPDIIKIDVEGEEYHVILGAVSAIQKYKPAFFIEIHTIECMFLIHKMFYEWGYAVDLIFKEPDGRCFIKAEFVK